MGALMQRADRNTILVSFCSGLLLLLLRGFRVESDEMTSSSHRWHVFLSSTSTDLAAYRAAVAAAVAGNEDFTAVQMEGWGARAAVRPAEQCEDKLRSCELYVAIIGHRYGSLVPPGDVPDGLADRGPLS